MQSKAKELIRTTAQNLTTDIMESLDEGTPIVEEADLGPTENWAEVLIAAEIDNMIEMLRDDADAETMVAYPALPILAWSTPYDDFANRMSALLRRYTRLLLWAAGDMQND